MTVCDESNHPQKPDRPLASIVFSDTGKVSRNVEHLPRTQKELELAIGTKFVSALKHFNNITLLDINPDEGQADFTSRLESGEIVLIQVTEVVDQSLRKIMERRLSYKERLVAEHSEIIRMFSGCKLTIVDSGSEPLLPRITTTEGTNALLEISNNLRELGSDIETLATGKKRVRYYSIGPDEVVIPVMCERIALPEACVPAMLSWEGGYVPESDYRSRLLAEGVRSKVTANYAKPDEQYWLLVYSSDIIPQPDDAEIYEAKVLLDRIDHPFDQVWFLYPYANRDLGHLVKVWPG